MEKNDVALAIAWLLLSGCIVIGSIMAIRAYLKKRNSEWASQHKRKYWLSFLSTIVVVLYIVSLCIFSFDELGVVHFEFLYEYPVWLGKDATALMGYIIIPSIVGILFIISLNTYQTIEKAEKKDEKKNVVEKDKKD